MAGRINSADSVAINFFKGDGTMDSVVAVRIITNKDTVQKIIAMVTEKTTSTMHNCGVSGSLHFFSKQVVTQDVDFYIGEGNCQQFRYANQGKLLATHLSKEAAALLTQQKQLQTISK